MPEFLNFWRGLFYGTLVSIGLWLLIATIWWVLL